MALIKSCLASGGAISFDTPTNISSGASNITLNVTEGKTYILGGLFGTSPESITPTGGTVLSVKASSGGYTDGGRTYVTGYMVIKATASTIALGTYGDFGYVEMD